MDQLASLYEDYHTQLQQFKRRMKPADGIFGMGGGLGDAPCHTIFAEKLEALLLEMAPDWSPQATLRALEFIYQAPLRETEISACWMLMAVHKLTLPLIGRLGSGEAAQMLEWYKAAYPRKDRLPPQNMVLKALKARASKNRGNTA